MLLIPLLPLICIATRLATIAVAATFIVALALTARLPRTKALLRARGFLRTKGAAPCRGVPVLRHAHWYCVSCGCDISSPMFVLEQVESEAGLP